MAAPGVLYVTMQPQEGLHLAQFHEWYNNEHGPTRLKLPHIFTNGLRYRATDGLTPKFLAIYDVTSMKHLTSPTYTNLRMYRSPREAETIAQVAVNRSFFDLKSTKQAANFRPIEALKDDEAIDLTLIAVTTTLRSTPEAEKEYFKWYQEEHIPMLSKVPGWLRTRFFRTSYLENATELTVLALHDYNHANGLGGPEHKAAMSTPWRDEVIAKYVTSKSRRTYKLFYVFGSGSRDLESLSQLPANAPRFTSPDTRTFTLPDKKSPVISSFVEMADGCMIPYRLEGSPDPRAPTIAFSNSLLTSLHMWDPLVAIIREKRPDFRILRYDTRGRHAIPHPPVPATLEVCADDLAALMSALRIPQLHALVGVSMGGATALMFALRYPARVEKFIACDFNVASSATNTDAWKARIQVAESAGEDGTLGIQKLAAATVERWFHPSSMQKPCATWMIDMVSANNIEGFRYGCQALWDYDMRPQMPGCRVPGLLAVGEVDGKGALVKAMEGFRGLIGEKGIELRIVSEAGHLPMCENPEGFWTAIETFL